MRMTIPMAVLCALASCGSAAESRERMDEQAHRLSDSIVRNIDSALSDPAKETGLLKPEAQIGTSSFTPAVKK
ncbi:MAG: hypothetical protein ACXVPQ_02820 [Bacteroidia bacterium]